MLFFLVFFNIIIYVKCFSLILLYVGVSYNHHLGHKCLCHGMRGLFSLSDVFLSLPVGVDSLKCRMRTSHWRSQSLHVVVVFSSYYELVVGEYTVNAFIVSPYSTPIFRFFRFLG